MPEYRIAPSLLSADFARLGDEVRAVIDAGADLLHFDVMDNHYVPNLTVGPLVCEALRAHASVPIDVHLMVKPVDRIVPDFAKAGAAIVSFHPEASEHVDRTIGLIRECGCRPGLVFNPATPLDWLDHTIDKLDLVLIMSVNPGFGGQAFIPGTLAKLGLARARVDAAQQRTGRQILLEVDGGVKIDNIAGDREGGRRYVRRRLGDFRIGRLCGDDRENARRARTRTLGSTGRKASRCKSRDADGIVALACGRAASARPRTNTMIFDVFALLRIPPPPRGDGARRTGAAGARNVRTTASRAARAPPPAVSRLHRRSSKRSKTS